jgi:hypothetical protein
MKEIIKHIDDEFSEFAILYFGAPILDELIELKARIEGWLLQNEQRVKDYYWTRNREESMSLNFCYKSFKIRLTFYNKGELKINLEHTYSHAVTVSDKKLREEFSADPGYVYFIESEFGWKIGKTRNIDSRKKVFDVKLPFDVALRYFIKTHEQTKLELFLHDYFKNQNTNGEWFAITVDDIKNLIYKNPELRLRVYYPDKHIKINKKYLV